MSPPIGTVVIDIRTGSRSGERLELTLPASVGRAPDCTLVLNEPHLSAQHGLLLPADGGLRYIDRGSSNGSVHVRGQTRTALQESPGLEAELWNGDELHLGDPESPVVLSIGVSESQAGEVVAVRPIAGVNAFAERITAKPGRLSVLYRHTAELGRSADLCAVLDVAAKLVFELLPRATHLAVALKERAGRFPVVLAQTRDGACPPIPISRTLTRRVMDEQAGLLVANALDELGSARSVVQGGIASALCVPLWTGDEIRGVLQVDNRDAPGLFSAEDLELLTVAAGPISFAAENARLVGMLRAAEQQLLGENHFLKARAQAESFPEIIGESAGMRAVLGAIEKVRDTRVPVLLLGETGTGKELLARAVHYTSKRQEKLFIAQNCSALPETLLESELFGHVKGAFTGADRDKKGLFELADGGTLFLDEIGEMPVLLQAKLLRVLQEGELWPLGASRPKRVDVRVVSATHRDLEKMVREGLFREDLYYRLHVFPVRVPPLRERREDIPVLARAFNTRFAQELGRPAPAFSPEALLRLQSYDWPGNVRELQNELQRVLILRGSDEWIAVEDLSPRILGQTGVVDDPQAPRGTLKDVMIGLERIVLIRALRENGNNKTRTAQVLGITREGLHKKLARYGLAD